MNKLLRIAPAKKPTNVSLPVDLVQEAKRLGINVSLACGAGLSERVRKAKATKWLEENREALDWSNEYVRKHGLPLVKHRMF